MLLQESIATPEPTVTETGASPGATDFAVAVPQGPAQSAVQDFVPPPSETVVREAELPATYTGPQIVSKDADLTPVPPSTAWGPGNGVSPYIASGTAQTTNYVPPAQTYTPPAQVNHLSDQFS